VGEVADACLRLGIAAALEQIGGRLPRTVNLDLDALTG